MRVTLSGTARLAGNLVWSAWEFAAFRRFLATRYGYRNLRPSGLSGWQFGCRHFTAEEAGGRRLFIKTGGRYAAARYECAAIERILAGDARHRDRLPTVVTQRLDGPMPFVVFEFIDERLLGDWIAAEAGSPPPELRDELLAILEMLSDAGLVHRDLRPDNLFLSRDARGRHRLRVIDFAFARSLDDDALPELRLTARDRRAMARLGSRYRKGRWHWNDAHSVSLMLAELGLDSRIPDALADRLDYRLPEP